MSIICSVCIMFREMGLEFVEVIKKKKSWELLQSFESHCLLGLFSTDASYCKQLRLYIFFIISFSANNNLPHLQRKGNRNGLLLLFIPPFNCLR